MNHGDTETRRKALERSELDMRGTRIVTAAMSVHREIGPGMLESIYETCLAYELRSRGSDVQVQAALPVVYRELRMEGGFRADMIVDNAVVLELKTVEKLMPVHEAQLLSYLRMSGHCLGYLINFHVPLLKHGIRRMVNGY